MSMPCLPCAVIGRGVLSCVGGSLQSKMLLSGRSVFIEVLLSERLLPLIELSATRMLGSILCMFAEPPWDGGES